jgi:hypothetical protein
MRRARKKLYCNTCQRTIQVGQPYEVDDKRLKHHIICPVTISREKSDEPIAESEATANE